jgi:hypothetical protein
MIVCRFIKNYFKGYQTGFEMKEIDKFELFSTSKYKSILIISNIIYYQQSFKNQLLFTYALSRLSLRI